MIKLLDKIIKMEVKHIFILCNLGSIRRAGDAGTRSLGIKIIKIYVQ